MEYLPGILPILSKESGTCSLNLLCCGSFMVLKRVDGSGFGHVFRLRSVFMIVSKFLDVALLWHNTLKQP